MKKFDAISNKAKFRAFAKTKPTTRKADARRVEDRLKAAHGLDEEEITKLKEGKLETFSK